MVNRIAYVYNDGGRVAAGFKGKAGDCVTRALALLTCPPDANETARGLHYRACYKLLANAQADRGLTRSARNGIAKRVSRDLFPRIGLIKVKLNGGSRPTFSEAYATYGNCIVSTTKHLVCLKNGALMDTYDCRTYSWRAHPDDDPVIMERKAASVWVVAPTGATIPTDGTPPTKVRKPRKPRAPKPTGPLIAVTFPGRGRLRDIAVVIDGQPQPAWHGTIHDTRPVGSEVVFTLSHNGVDVEFENDYGLSVPEVREQVAAHVRSTL